MEFPKTTQSYSYCIKRLQFAAFILFAALAFMQTIKVFSHVEMHMDRSPEVDQMEKDIDNDRNRESFDRVQENDNPNDKDYERADQYVQDNYS